VPPAAPPPWPPTIGVVPPAPEPPLTGAPPDDALVCPAVPGPVPVPPAPRVFPPPLAMAEPPAPVPTMPPLAPPEPVCGVPLLPEEHANDAHTAKGKQRRTIPTERIWITSLSPRTLYRLRAVVCRVPDRLEGRSIAAISCSMIVFARTRRATPQDSTQHSVHHPCSQALIPTCHLRFAACAIRIRSRQRGRHRSMFTSQLNRSLMRANAGARLRR
jgi:hypothetical protein